MKRISLKLNQNLWLLVSSGVIFTVLATYGLTQYLSYQPRRLPLLSEVKVGMNGLRTREGLPPLNCPTVLSFFDFVKYKQSKEGKNE